MADGAIVAPLITAAASGFQAEYLAIIPIALGIAVVPFVARKGWRFLTGLVR